MTVNVDTSSRASVNDSINKFVAIVKEAADPLFLKHYSTHNTARYRSTTHKPAVWFDTECRELKQKYKISLGNFNRNRTDVNRVEMCDNKSKYKQLVRRKRRQYEYKKIKDIERLRHSSPRQFWKLFSKKKNGNGNISTESFYKYFSELSNDINTVQHDEAEEFCSQTDYNEADCDYEEFNSEISISEVRAVIRTLKRNKAVGSDGLMNEYFIESTDILISHIIDIFNHVLSSGYLDSWTEGIIIPLLKKGDPEDVNNYRGITLMSCLSKIFTGVLNKRINKWCEENNVISDCQFGFRKGCSTTDAIFVLHNLIQKTLNDRGRLYCAFVDLKKAFDSIYRNALWYKMFNLGIKGRTFRIIRDMYAKVKSCVKSANTMSDFFQYAVYRVRYYHLCCSHCL